MKTRDLEQMGIPAGICAETGTQILQKAQTAKRSMQQVLDELRRVAGSPSAHLDDETYGGLAQQLIEQASAAVGFRPRAVDAPYRIWGENLESTAVEQLKNACKLPVAVSGALMP